jgi:hypothetical protein
MGCPTLKFINRSAPSPRSLTAEGSSSMVGLSHQQRESISGFRSNHTTVASCGSTFAIFGPFSALTIRRTRFGAVLLLSLAHMMHVRAGELRATPGDVLVYILAHEQATSMGFNLIKDRHVSSYWVLVRLLAKRPGVRHIAVTLDFHSLWALYHLSPTCIPSIPPFRSHCQTPSSQ